VKLTNPKSGFHDLRLRQRIPGWSEHVRPLKGKIMIEVRSRALGLLQLMKDNLEERAGWRRLLAF